MTTRLSRLSCPGKRRCCVLDAQERRPVETQKKLILPDPGTTCAYLEVASEQEGCRDSMPFHFDTKSKQSDCKIIQC